MKLLSAPAPGARLIAGIDELGLEAELSQQLQAYALPVHPPMAFAVSADETSATARRGRELSGHKKYWVLTTEDDARASGRTLGEVGPFTCLGLDPARPSERARLTQLGYQITFGLSVLLGGDPPERWRSSARQYREGSQVIVKLLREHPDDARVSLGAEEADLRGGLVRVRVPPGDHELQVSGGDQTRSYPISGSPAAPDSPPMACWINLRAPELTVQTLLGGGVAVEVDGSAPVEGLQLTVELTTAGQRLSVTVPLGALPQFVTAEHELWHTLLDDAARARVLRDPRPTIRVRVGALADSEWQLESHVSPCWWSAASPPSLECESGPLGYGAVPLTAPTRAPTSLEVEEEGVFLLAPVELPLDRFGPAAPFTTLCVAPDRLRLDAPSLSKPRLRRQARAGGGSIGLEDLLESYLRWSLAETRTLTAELRRRQVVASLDRWTAELCCGEEWALLEESVSGAVDPWTILERVLSAEQTNLGRDPDVELSADDQRKLVRFAVAEIRRVRPALWTQVGPPCDLDSGDYGALDLACGRAYEELAAEYRARGVTEVAELVAAGDPYAGAEEWDKALERVTATTRRLDLAALMLPTDTAENLAGLDLSFEPPSALVEELARWARASKKALTMGPPGEPVLDAIVALWTAPEDAVKGDWRQAIPHLLAERSLARAARYLSLLWRQSHRGGAA